MPKKIEARVKKAISERVFPGCVIGIIRANGSREIWPSGSFTYESTSPPVREDTVYDMASVTKSIPVASLALTFIREGKIRLTDKVVSHLPELQHDHGATIEDLLRYRVRGPRMSTLPFRTFEEVRTHVLETGFDGPPGEEHYANVPAFILGLLLERVGGAILPALADTYFFGPLGMRDTTFFPHDTARIPPTELVGGQEVRGVVHDETARIFALKRRAIGHAGLFSTAPDLLTFLDVLFGGKLPEVLEGAKKGLGWQKAEAWFMGEHCSSGSFGKTGFTGTSIAVDPVKNIGFVILSNRTYPTRPLDAASLTSAVNMVRRDIADIVLR